MWHLRLSILKLMVAAHGIVCCSERDLCESNSAHWAPSYDISHGADISIDATRGLPIFIVDLATRWDWASATSACTGAIVSLKSLLHLSPAFCSYSTRTQLALPHTNHTSPSLRQRVHRTQVAIPLPRQGQSQGRSLAAHDAINSVRESGHLAGFSC